MNLKTKVGYQDTQARPQNILSSLIASLCTISCLSTLTNSAQLEEVLATQLELGLTANLTEKKKKRKVCPLHTNCQLLKLKSNFDAVGYLDQIY